MKNIIQEPFASTLMSSIKAAYKYYYEEDISDSLLFGLSGHAFVTHFTNGLGPCAPYTFDMKEFNSLVNDNLGLDMFVNQEFIAIDADEDFKENATIIIKNYLDDGYLVLLSSYEYQLIYDYNDTHFLTTLPWADAPSETPNIEFNTFDGMKEFLVFFKIIKTDKINRLEGVRKAIKYAIDMVDNPPVSLDSGIGIHAYDFFLEKVNEENAIGHGLWWTSSVWSESRKMASLFMKDLEEFFDKNILLQLSEMYMKSSELFFYLSNKDSNKDEKIRIIKDLKKNELEIVQLLRTL